MPRYFFDFDGEAGPIPDGAGTVLDGLAAARREAARTLARTALDEAGSDVALFLAVDVRDEARRRLARAELTLYVETS